MNSYIVYLINFLCYNFIIFLEEGSMLKLKQVKVKVSRIISLLLLFSLQITFNRTSLEKSRNSIKYSNIAALKVVTKTTDDGTAYQDLSSDSGDDSSLLSNHSSNTYYNQDDLDSMKSNLLSEFLKYDDRAYYGLPDDFKLSYENCGAISYENLEEYLNHGMSFEDLWDLAKHDSTTFPKQEDYTRPKPPTKKQDRSYDVKIINVMVSGIGGAPYHFSNNGIREVYLRDDTLPGQITTLYDSKCFIIDSKCDNDFLLYEIIENEKSEKDINISSADISDGTVFLYHDETHKNSSTNYYYECFRNTMIELRRRFPEAKFNLFGHSRGGDINLKFASEFPDLINNIFSMGTPYYSPYVANLDEFLENNKDSNDIISMISGFRDSLGLNHCDAYSSLCNEKEMRDMRIGWNQVHYKPNLYTYGYDLGYRLSWFINLFGLVLRVDLGVAISWDVLVGSDNAVGLPTSSFSLGLFGLVATFNGSWDYSEPLEVTDREIICITLDYMMDVINNKKEKLKSLPYNYAIPHNLETMHPTTINKIMEILKNE